MALAVATASTVLVTIATTIAGLVVFDVIGTVGALILGSDDLQGFDVVTLFVWWFVLGIFCGMMIGHGASSLRPSANAAASVRTHAIAVGTVWLVLLALLFAAERYMWPGDDSSGFVPDNKLLTIAFFLATAVGSFFTAGDGPR